MVLNRGIGFLHGTIELHWFGCLEVAMKRYFAALFIGCLLVLLSYFSLPNMAQAAYSVDPLRVEVNLNKPTSVAVVKVQNNGSESIRLKAYMEDWTLNETGDILIGEENTSGSLKSWVRFNPKEFEIPANQTQILRLALTPTMDVATGEYRGLLFFEDLKTQNTRLENDKGLGASVEVKQRLGIAVYAYKGSLKPSITLGQLTSAATPAGINTAITVENTGDKHGRVTASLLLSKQDEQGHYKPVKEIALNSLREMIILPRQKRLISALISPEADWPKLDKGQYQIELNLSVTGDAKQIEHSSSLVSQVVLDNPIIYSVKKPTK